MSLEDKIDKPFIDTTIEWFNKCERRELNHKNILDFYDHFEKARELGYHYNITNDIDRYNIEILKDNNSLLNTYISKYDNGDYAVVRGYN